MEIKTMKTYKYESLCSIIITVMKILIFQFGYNRAAAASNLDKKCLYEDVDPCRFLTKITRKKT